MARINYTQSKKERDRVLQKRRLMAAIALVHGARDMMDAHTFPDDPLTPADAELLEAVNEAMRDEERQDYQTWCTDCAIKDGMAAIREIAHELGLVCRDQGDVLG